MDLICEFLGINHDGLKAQALAQALAKGLDQPPTKPDFQMNIPMDGLNMVSSYVSEPTVKISDPDTYHPRHKRMLIYCSTNPHLGPLIEQNRSLILSLKLTPCGKPKGILNSVTTGGEHTTHPMMKCHSETDLAKSDYDYQVYLDVFGDELIGGDYSTHVCFLDCDTLEMCDVELPKDNSLIAGVLRACDEIDGSASEPTSGSNPGSNPGSTSGSNPGTSDEQILALSASDEQIMALPHIGLKYLGLPRIGSKKVYTFSSNNMEYYSLDTESLAKNIAQKAESLDKIINKP